MTKFVSIECKRLLDILQKAQKPGSKPTLPEVSNKVPILNFSNVSDDNLQFIHSLLIVQTTNSTTACTREKMLSDLINIVPYASVQQTSEELPPQRNCENCNQKFNLLHRVNYTCYQCKKQFCKKCDSKQTMIPRLKHYKCESFCLKCFEHLMQQDVDDWIKISLELIEAGTLESIKAAMGCVTIALCLSGFSNRPMIKIARGLYSYGLPELAIPFIATILQHSDNSRESLGVYVLAAQIFKTMADKSKSHPETQWNFLLAAKDSCNLALEKASCLDTSVEIPNLTSVHKDVFDALNLLREQQERIHDLEVQLLGTQYEALWQKRDHEGLLALALNERDEENSESTISFLPHLEDMALTALKQFLASKDGFLDKMLSEDKCALIFFRGVLKIKKSRIIEGLTDIEEAAYHGHHHQWLKDAVVDLLVSLLIDAPCVLFPADSLKEALQGKHLQSSEAFQDRSRQLFPHRSQLTPPFSRNWPELTITGLNIKGHTRFEKAVVSQVTDGTWRAWDVAVAYIDYIPACCHPAEVTLCFTYAAMWLLKELQTILASAKKPPMSEVYATKNLIVKCLECSLLLVRLRLHPGMQLYVSRLCLGTIMETMQLTTNFGSDREVDLVTNLLQLMIYTCRFCPVWSFPSVPLSEAVLINLKSGQLHQKFLLALQHVKREELPMTRSELLYQIYENDLRYICALDDSAGARARAMEEMLHEKGWTWEDVATLMTSPLSPRDQEGWLIQQPILGLPLEFSELKGFAFNLDPECPSIEIIAIPADRSRGRVGLFSMEDVQTVLQLDADELYPIFFSLDSPNSNQRFHPFQQFRYGTETLQNTSLLHTMFETDYLLKSFSVGAEVSAKPPFNQRPCREGLTKRLPSHLCEAIKPIAERGSCLSNIHRFWIQAGDLIYDQTQSGSKVQFRLGNLKMKVRSHPLLPGMDGNLQDTEVDDNPDSPEAKFAADLTAHYDEIGLHFPMFARLRELSKLQLLGIILRSIIDDLKEKAEGKGVEVSKELLTEIQRAEHQRHQTQILEMLRKVGQQVGVWPAAEDRNEISSMVRTMRNQLPYDVRNQTSYYDIEPYALKTLRTRDSNALSSITDSLVKLCSNRISRSNMERAVRQWLSSRSSSSIFTLRDLICSALPLSTREDIKKMMIEMHQKKYSSFQQKVLYMTPLPAKTNPNPCKWVPAALLKIEDSNTVSMCYGGVLIAPKIRRGRVAQFPTHARSVPIQQPHHGYNKRPAPSRPTFHASSRPSVPVDKASNSSSGGSATGESGDGGSSGNAGSRSNDGSRGGSGENDGTPPPSPPPTHRSAASNGRRNRNWTKSADKGSSLDIGQLRLTRAISSIVGCTKRAYHSASHYKKPGLFHRDKNKGAPDVHSPPVTTLSAVQSVKILVDTIQNAQPGIYNAVNGLAHYNELLNKNSPCGARNCKCCSQIAQNILVTNGTKQCITSLSTSETCKARNVVYLMQCRKTGLVYIGMTTQPLHKRLGQHRTDKNSAIYKHITSNGFSFSDLDVMILARTDVKDETELRRIEQGFIDEYDAKNPSIGLNIATAYSHR